MAKIITLCTDFGLSDGYVAAMKGVILSLAPEVVLVDISHEITRQSVREGAFVFDSAHRVFPPGTLHLVVIDPGVGGERRAIAVRTKHYIFVAPDNGVLTYALQEAKVLQAVSLTNRAYWRNNRISDTFHGRDLFAPASAHLINGVPLAELGPPISDLVHLDHTTPTQTEDGRIRGHVIHVDHFGNLVTDIPAALLPPRKTHVVLGSARIKGLCSSYASVARGEYLALIGSDGSLEIAVREGNAAQALEADVGDEVWIE